MPKPAPMRFPSPHISADVQRIDLACFVSQIGTGPEFVWKCPLCLKHCGDDIPVMVDKHVLGILESVGRNSWRKYYKVGTDGEICDETDGESGDDDGDVGDVGEVDGEVGEVGEVEA
jgi:hypothetical protein